MKIKIMFVFLLMFSVMSFARLVPYISPGFTLGYNIDNNCFSFIPKLSLGVVNVEEGPYIYANITGGWNFLTRKSDRFNYSNYSYIEFQAGNHLLGLGIGKAFLEDRLTGIKKTVPKYSFCAGFWIYLNWDVVKLGKDWNDTLGIQVTLPIPLGPIDLF